MATCGRKNRAGGPCRLPAGWGTDHPGAGACRKHGGSGGAPAGNQNARTHGGYSALADALTDEERELWGAVGTEPDDVLDHEIRMATLQQRRVLRFIRDKMRGAVSPAFEAALARISAQKLRAVEAKLRRGAGGDGRDGLDEFLDALGRLRDGEGRGGDGRGADG